MNLLRCWPPACNIIACHPGYITNLAKSDCMLWYVVLLFYWVGGGWDFYLIFYFFEFSFIQVDIGHVKYQSLLLAHTNSCIVDSRTRNKLKRMMYYQMEPRWKRGPWLHFIHTGWGECRTFGEPMQQNSSRNDGSRMVSLCLNPRSSTLPFRWEYFAKCARNIQSMTNHK